MEAEREFDKRAKAGKTDQFGRPKIMDGEIVTACQAACPTGAITFGDINDSDSAVLRAKAEEHNYGLLAELNTMPRTSYLAAIRNPNPAMPKGA
jgi:Fe-S-cluster-containing dehydrogenase component